MSRSRSIIPPKSKFNANTTLLSDIDTEGKPELFPYPMSKEPISINPDTEFHVNHLKSLFSDVARPNLFKIKIIPPNALKGDWDQGKDGLMALAKSTRIPSITVKDWVYERAGQKLFIPTGEIEHGEASITFINDSDFTIRTMFTRWIRSALHNWKLNKGSLPQLALQGQVIIYQYNSELKPTYMIKLINAWPSMISEIELSQESENVAEEFTVGFKYSFQEIYKNYEDL